MVVFMCQKIGYLFLTFKMPEKTRRKGVPIIAHETATTFGGRRRNKAASAGYRAQRPTARVPIMGSATCVEADQAWRKLLKELQPCWRRS